jgi:exosortase
MTLMHRLWPVFLLVALMLFLYRKIAWELILDWYKNEDDAHGFIVLPLSMYFVWRGRHVLAGIPREPAWVGLLLVSCSLGLLFLGSMGAELFLARLSWLGTAAGLVIYFRGWRTLRALAFPLLFSLLMIPLPSIVYYQLTFPLQLLASRLTMAGLQQLNMFPVIREGNLLFLPHYTLEVVAACSGIRSLMALLAFALGYGYLAQGSRMIRGVLVLLVVPLAVGCNAVRVMVEALLVRSLGPDIAQARWHQLTGLVTFACAAVLLLVADRIFGAIRMVGIESTAGRR